jgi:hypothetical protein
VGVGEVRLATRLSWKESLMCALLGTTFGISDAFQCGREQNKAVTRLPWNGERFLYHGMNHLIYVGTPDSLGTPYVPSAADLVATDWVLVPDWPYHGWLEQWGS